MKTKKKIKSLFCTNKSSILYNCCSILTSFLPYTVNEWNKLDIEIRRIDSYVGFRKKLLSFIKPTENKTFSIYDPLGIKLLNRLRVDFSHLNEHRFRHNFAHTLNPLCLC